MFIKNLIFSIVLLVIFLLVSCQTMKKKVTFPINGKGSYGGYKVSCLINKKYKRLYKTRVENNNAKIGYTIILYKGKTYVVTSDIHSKEVSNRISTQLVRTYKEDQNLDTTLVCEDELVRVFGIIK